MTPRRCKVIPFPIERARKPAPPEPKRIKLHWDFNEWYAVEYEGQKRSGSRRFPNMEQAQDDIRRCVETGFELLPPSEAAIAQGAERLGGAA